MTWPAAAQPPGEVTHHGTLLPALRLNEFYGAVTVFGSTAMHDLLQKVVLRA